MIYRRMPAALRVMPEFLQRYVLDFEARIEDALRQFASELPAQARVLDAGAGEAQYASLFRSFNYVAVDLGIGDTGWEYDALDAIAALECLPFADNTFDAALNIVTLEHVREPKAVVAEIARVLKPGGRLLLVTPFEWEEHQQPHDYYRYTQYGLRYLVESTGMSVDAITSAGGLFRVLSRRLFNAGQSQPWLLPIVGPLALLSPLLDSDSQYTLGHITSATKRRQSESYT